MSVFDEVTIILVCYNSEDLIKRNLDEIKKFQTVIIDNSDSKQTFNLIKDFSNITYIGNKNNIGYGLACNLGVHHAKTPYIMILNPDILINSLSIEILYKTYSNYDNVGILVPGLYDESKNRRSNGSISHFKKNKCSNKVLFKSNNLAEGNTCYDFAVGCAYFMNKSFFKSIGGFSKSFFMYFEDNELCDRVYINNKTVIEVPSSKMVHMQGLSSKKNFIIDCKLSLIHKISEYIYLKKKISYFILSYTILKHFLDYSQRCILNLFRMHFKKSFKNLLRIISILMYITTLYKLMY